MPLIRTLETIRVPPGTHIDLTPAQYDARAHRVVRVGVSQYEDRLTVSPLETLEFKRGEILGIESPGKDLAGKIEILDPEQPPVEEAAPPASADAPSADEAETTGAEEAAPVGQDNQEEEAGAKPDTEAEGTATVTAGEVAASPGGGCGLPRDRGGIRRPGRS